MSLSPRVYRNALAAAAFSMVATSAGLAQANTQNRVEAGGRPRANGADPEEQDRRSGKGRFADGFFTGRFRRRGFYSSLTLGFSNCVDGRNGAKCEGPLGTGETKSSFAFTKEIGYRIPWVFVGGSYSLGFLRPSWGTGSPSLALYDLGYQHSLLAVIRPTLPIWRVDLGFSLSPGWSRQVVIPGKFSNRNYTQGFALGLGAVASFNITRGWIVGVRWDVIKNYHNKVCAVSGSAGKQCIEVDSNSVGGLNMGISGLFLSHRW